MLELFTPPTYLTDIIKLQVKKNFLDISSLQADYEKKGLSLRQFAAQKVHSKASIQQGLKRANVQLCAPGHGYGNPSQLRFGFRKEAGRVVSHMGEQLVISAVKDLKDEGMTLRQLAHRLTVLGIHTKNGKRKWHPMMVKRVLDHIS